MKNKDHKYYNTPFGSFSTNCPKTKSYKELKKIKEFDKQLKKENNDKN